MLKENEAVLENLTNGQAQRAWLILTNQYPKRKFYTLVWAAQDTNYTYTLFIEGRANAEMRAYAAGVKAALLALDVK